MSSDLQLRMTSARTSRSFDRIFCSFTSQTRTRLATNSGGMGGSYGRAIATTDAALGRLLSDVDKAYGAGNYSVIVTADHGGHDFDHGSDDPRDVTIPWIAWGQGVRQGTSYGVRIETFDTAPTVLWMLGVPTACRLGRLTGARRVSVRPARAEQTEGVPPRLKG